MKVVYDLLQDLKCILQDKEFWTPVISEENLIYNETQGFSIFFFINSLILKLNMF